MQTKVKRRKAKELFIRRCFIVTVSMICILVSILACKGFVKARGKEKNTHSAYNTYYTSVELKSGDTLWSIAEEYMPEDYSSIQEYIDTLKDINGLKSDDIYAERYLTVAYQDTDY